MAEENITNPDDVLEYTNCIRKKIVRKFLGDQDKIPEDLREVQTLAGVLSDMDRTALTVKRIASDKENTDKLANSSAAIMAGFLKQINTNNANEVFENVVPPKLPDSIQKPHLVPGETDIGTNCISIESIIGDSN